MPHCKLHYIPDKLHWNNKPVLTEFQVGDLIFRRCKPEEIENPFGTISLRDISNNIGTCLGREISVETDVLFNISPESSDETYKGLIVCTLKIRGLSAQNQYEKVFEDRKNDQVHRCLMMLIHDPLDCMYPHCIFRIWLDDVIVTKDNYNITLKRHSKIRTRIRQELATMILRETIDVNFT